MLDPHRPADLRQPPSATFLPLNGKEKVYGATPLRSQVKGDPPSRARAAANHPTARPLPPIPADSYHGGPNAARLARSTRGPGLHDVQRSPSHRLECIYSAPRLTTVRMATTSQDRHRRRLRRSSTLG